MEKSRKYKVESEKGSVTLYILVAMLFFLIILILTYTNQANKISDQRRQVEKIYEEYKTEEKIEQEYYEVEGKLPVTITLYKPSGEIYDINEWTNQDLSLKIFYPGGIVEEAKYFYLDGIKTKYQEGLKITKNSKIEVDDRGHKAEVIVTRIDKELPTVQIEPNGENYSIPVESTTNNISTNLQASDTGGSGLNLLQYQITTSQTIPDDEDSNWKDFISGNTIREEKTGGTYYLYTKVTDLAGNRAISIQKSNAFTLKYQVLYDANGGTGAPSEQAKGQGEDLTLSSTKPTRTGYTFRGWATTNNATTAQYLAGGEYKNNEAVRLYAVWSINQYKATFNSNGGTAANPTSITKNYGAQWGTLPTTTKIGYSFSGWYTAASGGTKITTTTTVPANNVTYYAHWVDNIVPVMGTLTKSPTGWTNGNVTITGKATDTGSGISYYQFSTNSALTASSSGWISITNTKSEITKTQTVSSNATWYFYVKDAAGNINKKSIVISNIDKSAPTIASLTASTTAWSKANVTLTGKATDTLSGISYYQFSTSSTLTAASSGWATITNTKSEISKTYSATATGTYYFYVKDAAGNVTKKSVAVKIDKTVPTISGFTATPNGDTTSNLKLTGADKGGSGLKNCRITATGFDKWYTFTGTLNVTVAENKTYKVIVYDNAGNASASKSVTTGVYNYNIDNTAWTKTLSDAITKAKASGSTIKLIRNVTDNSAATVSKTFTFNLNGKTLTRGVVITVNSGKGLAITGSGTISCTSASVNMINNYGSVAIYNGTFRSSAGRNQYNSTGFIANRSGATMNISGGSFTTDGHTIVNEGGSLTISSGTVTSTGNSSGVSSVWNKSGTSIIKTATINNTTTGNGNAILNWNGGTVELHGTTANGRVDNQGTFRIYNATTITRKDFNNIGIINSGNMSIEGASTRLIGGSSSRGFFSNTGNVWHNGGTISVTSGTAVWNEGSWFKQGGIISGSSNV